MGDEPAIIVDGVSKMYHKRAGMGTLLSMIPGFRPGGSDEFWALKDVSFEVRPGECLGIIGPNGAGKSTILKVLSRVTSPTSGRFEVKGRLSSLIEVGAGFHPELTGRENVYLNAAILGMSKREADAKFDEIVDFAELRGFIDVPVKRYSSGMYVRLGFAVAAHLVTEVLLVDEVLAVGDAAFQKKCLNHMQDATGQGRTVVFISHNMHAIRAFCSRAVLLSQGRLVAEGQPADVIRTYLGGRAAVGERRWSAADAPGNELFRVTAVRMLDDTRTPHNVIQIEDESHVEIEYEVLGGPTHIGHTMVLSTSDGVIAFSSIDGAVERTRGRYVARYAIPAHLLNEGTFTVTALVWQVGFKTVVRVDDAVGFRCVQGAPRIDGFFREWAGVVRPQLAWQTEPGPAGRVDQGVS